MFHKSDRAPSIIGNDFWHRHKAVFNYPLECIQLMNADGSIDNSIPFRCRRPQPYADAVAAAAEEQSLSAETRIPVRARETVVLRPREGCVIQPQLDCELGLLNHSDTLVMAPELSAVRVVLDDTKRSGCSQVPFHCMPLAAVSPKFSQEEGCYTALTSIINMGSQDLVVNKGDVVAYMPCCCQRLQKRSCCWSSSSSHHRR